MKIFKSLIAIVLLISTIFSISACTLFYSPKENKEKTNSNITIIYPDSQETVVFDKVKENKIEPKYIDGKILEGYYANENGNGIEYIDFLGRAIDWQNEYPTTLYAVYKDADYTVKYTSKIQRDEDPEYSKYYYGATKTKYNFGNFGNLDMVSNEEFAKLLYADSSKKVKITAYAEVKRIGSTRDENGALISIKVGADSLDVVEKDTIHGSYMPISTSSVIKAKQLISGNNNIYVYVGYRASTLSSETLVKNVYITIEFVE
ncbi:MAG: hypothetical protein IJD42_07945 [Clostridia bacterium]|nr:hypothetical protein [Clostridia bacterium]